MGTSVSNQRLGGPSAGVTASWFYQFNMCFSSDVLIFASTYSRRETIVSSHPDCDTMILKARGKFSQVRNTRRTQNQWEPPHEVTLLSRPSRLRLCWRTYSIRLIRSIDRVQCWPSRPPSINALKTRQTCEFGCTDTSYAESAPHII